MKINLILEEDEEQGIFTVYLSGKLVATCHTHDEVEKFLGNFEKEHMDDNIILRFA